MTTPSWKFPSWLVVMLIDALLDWTLSLVLPDGVETIPWFMPVTRAVLCRLLEGVVRKALLGSNVDGAQENP